MKTLAHFLLVLAPLTYNDAITSFKPHGNAILDLVGLLFSIWALFLLTNYGQGKPSVSLSSGV